jgi:hypothetical protein
MQGAFRPFPRPGVLLYCLADHVDQSALIVEVHTGNPGTEREPFTSEKTRFGTFLSFQVLNALQYYEFSNVLTFMALPFFITPYCQDRLQTRFLC